MKIFLDADGVLINFIKGVAEPLGIDEELLKKKNFHDIVDQKEMWKHIDREGSAFWENLEPLPWADELLNHVRSFMRPSDEMYILTSPGDSAESYTGKANWFKKRYPKIFRSGLIITKHKQVCATRNSLLIDDFHKNIDRFINAGGYGYLFPYQYDITDINDVYEDIADKIIFIQQD